MKQKFKFSVEGTFEIECEDEQEAENYLRNNMESGMGTVAIQELILEKTSEEKVKEKMED